MAHEPTGIDAIYADFHQRQRKQRIIDACIVGLVLLSTHALAAMVGAYVWHLIRGC